MLRTLKIITALVATMSLSESAMAFSHDYIMFNRSSVESDIWFSQSFGVNNSSLLFKSQNSDLPASSWKGAASRSEFGIETLKFFQLSAGMENLKLKKQDSSSTSIEGIRAFSEFKLVFSAPIFNVEVGGGIIGGNLEYSNLVTSASLFSMGKFYSFGINHYLTSRVSIFGKANSSMESIRRTGGDPSITGIDGTVNTFSAGLRISL
jgi:hypothetical protein